MRGAVPTLPELLALRAAATRLVWTPPRRVRAGGTGQRSSRFRGRGIDFAETRAYQPGDDIRHIDWRVTARTGRVHTKVFHEERERPVLLLADLGPQTFFGTRQRLNASTELATYSSGAPTTMGTGLAPSCAPQRASRPSALAKRNRACCGSRTSLKKAAKP